MSVLKKVLGVVASVSLIALSQTASATIVLTPDSPGMIAGYGYGPSNCEPTCVNTVFANSSTLDLLYKADVGSADSGLFATSYATGFFFTSSEPSAAQITYSGGTAISCTVCYLAIKDGNHSPGYYFYNLTKWDGIESIELSEFWPERGAISHVSIWGVSTTSVPEPATLTLLGLGLLGVGVGRRKKKA